MVSAKVRLAVSPDKMSVTLDCDEADMEETLLLAEIQGALAELKVPGPPDLESIVKTVKEARDEASRVSGLTIIRGLAATPPVDGRIEWARDFFSSGWAVVNQAVDRVDYRERAASKVVKNGEIAGKVIVPQEGSAGRDVCGNPILAARAKKDPHRYGKNIKFDERNGQIQSTVDGMIRITNGTVEVDEVYMVDTAGLESGNIRFPGAVVVGKDVEDLAVIEAEGTVEVGGVVWEASIKAGGDVVIRRGLSGREKCLVRSKGTVSAAYVLNADIEAEEGVLVRKEIVHSKIRCRGTVNVDSGRIVGGETVALGEIVVAEAGSDGNVSTLLVAGEDYRLSGALKAKNVELGKLRNMHKKIHDNIDPVMEKLPLLSPQQREAVAALTARADELAEKIKVLHKEIEETCGDSLRRSANRIRILKMLHPGVTLRLQGISRHITRTHKGPMTVEIDPEKNTLRF